MRYRRDIPLELLDQHGFELVNEITAHICEHLLGAVHPEDDPRGFKLGDQPLLTLYKEEGLTPSCVSLIGEVDAEPNAPYLKSGFDPATDHPEIMFRPFEDVPAGRVADHDNWEHWITHGHHERPES